jgi:predicted nucleotidyltransferase
VSKYLDILKREGVLKKVNGKFVVTDSPLTKGIRILLSVRGIDTKALKKYLFVKGVGLYGSCAKGENTEDSDVDLWVRVENASDEDLASLTSYLNKRMKNVKVLFLTDEKIRRIREEDRLFYQSLVFGSIIVYGDKDGIQI